MSVFGDAFVHGQSFGWILEVGAVAALIATPAIFLFLFVAVRKQARKLAAVEEKLGEQSPQAIIKAIGDAVVTFDAHGDILSFNPAAERIFGYPEGEICGEHFSLLAAPDDRAWFEQSISDSDRGFPRIIGHQRPLKGQRKGGRTFDMEMTLSAMDPDGTRSFIGVCSDVTARRHEENELRGAKERAETENQSKSEFLAKMSHELRTPLNAVIGFSEIIKNQTMGPVGSPLYREYATDIYDSGQHLLGVINTILDLSKIEAGKTELHDEEFDVAEPLVAIMNFVRMRAQKEGVTLTLEAPETRQRLYADRLMFKQVLTNLLSNAVKFTERGGAVTLRYWSRDDSGFVFQVVDTGVGIALEDIPKCLAPFSQVDSKLGRKGEGTGLGLPLAKSMVELHGGTLDMQSQVGAGTTVTVRFPAARLRKRAVGARSLTA
ncbi:MAG: PAS domain-containing sensor histidine kinase [Alphaproteobacteria bacterium]